MIKRVTLNRQRYMYQLATSPVALATRPQATRHRMTLATEIQVSDELSGVGFSVLRPSRRAIQTVDTRMTKAPNQVH